MTGTLINVAAVLAGSAVGALAGRRLPEGLQQRVLAGLGLLTLVLGVELALDRRGASFVYVLGAVLLGGLLGELLGLERRLERLGDRLQAAAAARGDRSRVSEAFVAASLLFCVGPLTVTGSLQDGLTGESTLLSTKGVLDGFASVALASALGWGVALSAIVVLIVQGGLTLAAGLFEDVLRGEALGALTSAGGVLIVGISLKLLDLKDVRVGNFLPALVLAPALVGLAALVG